RMGADSNSYRLQTGSDNFGNNFPPRQDKGKRSGPELRDQFLNQTARFIADPGNAFEPFAIWQMNDKRVEARALLRLENFRDGFTRERIGCEAINGFRRQCDDIAASQRLCCAYCGLRALLG